MDQVDANLLEAWSRVCAKLKSDPHMAAVRFERGMRGIMRQPMAACCLVIRASDQRIDEEYDFLETKHDLAAGDPHRVVINLEQCERLCKPVEIPWPGVSYHQAAILLGMTIRMVYRWIERGVLRHRLDRMHGMRRPPTPYVWSDTTLINPNYHEGRLPLPMWGDLWKTLWKGWPDDFEQRVFRVPRLRPWCGQDMRRGWDFLCQGRPRAGDGKRIPCGRTCGKLYAPIPLMTIQQFYGLTPPVELYQPPRQDPIFACNRCWAPRYDDQSQPEAAWNKFVSHISGGLLRGREVKRPDDLPMRREEPVPEDDLPPRVRSMRRLGPKGDRRRHGHIQ